MKLLISEIQDDINWRISQLSIIKTLPTKYGMRKLHIETLTWYSVPSIYALWEGYFRNTFKLYSDFLNKKKLTIHDVDINILTHAIDNECQLREERVHFPKQKDLVQKLFFIFQNPLNIGTDGLNESNLNFKETNIILERYNLEPLDDTFHSRLNKLLKFRNHIAHGEKSIVVEKSHIIEFTFLVEDLMYEILLRISDSCDDETFLFE